MIFELLLIYYNKRIESLDYPYYLKIYILIISDLIHRMFVVNPTTTMKDCISSVGFFSLILVRVCLRVSQNATSISLS